MSQFNYKDYSEAVEKAQATQNKAFAKVGFFKLPNDGDEALVRINCASLDDLQFASVHQLGAAQKWMKISCLNPLPVGIPHHCPLCDAAATDTSISPARKKVYIQMLTSYRDSTTGQWSAPVSVIWERPAGFSREIAGKLRDFGNLKEVLLKIRRNGAKGAKDTTYTLDYAMPTVYSPSLIPADFSAFDNFSIDKHSFWIKTAEEMTEFLTTGAFPETIKKLEDTTQVGEGVFGKNLESLETKDNPFDTPAQTYSVTSASVSTPTATAADGVAAPTATKPFERFTF